MTFNMGVIITSAKYHNALAAIRCLGKHGIKVACGEDKRAETSFFPMGFYSKYCSKRFVYPPYYENPEGFIKHIINFANKNREYDVLMPIDAETVIISKYKEVIEEEASHLKIPVHDYKYISMANNKKETIKLANEIGIPTPKTYTPESIDEVKDIADDISYPAVIKLPITKGSKGLSYVHDKEELIRMYKETVNRFSSFPLIQEYIPGIGYGVSCLFNLGEPKAIFTHKRRREASVSGGPSVARISVRHEEMERYAVKILKRLNWHGVAMVEFKLDVRDNKPKLMEINPRFWGSLYQAIASGVEFPYLLYKIATEGDVEPVLSYKLGVETRYILGDIYAFPDYMLRSDNKIDFLKDFFNIKGESFDDLSFKDPVPFVAALASAAIRFIKTHHFGERDEIDLDKIHVVCAI